MKNTVQQIPFLRPVIVLIAGILIATVVTFPLKALLAVILCLFFALILIHRSFTFSLFSQEICNNGIDDDGDGLIDALVEVDAPTGLETTSWNKVDEVFLPQGKRVLRRGKS